MVVDVGQGDCTVVVDGRTKRALLIDCPKARDKEAFAALEQLDFSRLDAVVVTHSHLDHFGGVLDVIDRLQVPFGGKLYVNQDTLPSMAAASGWSPSDLDSLYLRLLELDDSQVDRADSSIGTQSLGGTSWTLVAPTYLRVIGAVRQRNPNLASGIVIIKSDGQSMVVGGDAPLASWQAAQSRLPHEAVVRWPHHGGAISSARNPQQRLSDQRQLLNLLRPSDVLVSVGHKNSHDHPQDEFFQAVQQHGLAPVCTQATPKCTAGGDGTSCAGSIRVELDSSTHTPTVTPSRSRHDQFVASLESPRCM